MPAADAGPRPDLIALERARRAFFAEAFPDFWSSVGDEPYALLATQPISAGDVLRLRAAARDAWAIFERTLPILQRLPDDELVAIGIPRVALPIVRQPPRRRAAAIARFDFALTPDGPKLLELNAETPFFIVESHRIAGAIVEHLGGVDPNAGSEERLRAGIRRTLADVPSGASVAVTAMNPYREDWFTAVYLAEMIAASAERRTVTVVPVSELAIEDDRLVDGARRQIDVLWRMYPLEHFARDPDGARFVSLVDRGRLAIVNPPAALLLQCKAAQAVIWGLHAAGAWYSPAEHETIERLFLPSSMDVPPDGTSYVRKPVLGREGNSVTIVDADGIVEAEQRTYAAQPALYQQLVDLPAVRYVDPLRGVRVGYGVHTAFVVDGEITAIALRVGERITDGWAQALPLRIAEPARARAT